MMPCPATVYPKCDHTTRLWGSQERADRHDEILGQLMMTLTHRRFFDLVEMASSPRYIYGSCTKCHQLFIGTK